MTATPHAPACYTRPRELTPAMRRLFVARHWIDARTVQRIERPDPEHVARLYRLREIEAAPEPTVEVKA